MAVTRRPGGVLALIVTTALVLVGLAPPATAVDPASITGTVSAPAGTLYRGWVRLYRWDATFGVWSHMYDDEVRAEDSYTFTFTGLGVGAQYTLEYVPYGTATSGYAPSQAFGATQFEPSTKVPRQVITGAPGAQTVSFALSPGVEVTGKVVRPAGVTGPVQVALFAPIMLREHGVLAHIGAIVVERTEVGADGSYSIPGALPGGTYSIATLDHSYSSTVPLDRESVSLTGTGTYAGTRSFRGISGPTTLPTATMQSTVAVTGKFVAPAGVSIAGATAELIEVDRAGYTRPVTSTTVGADGTFGFPQGAFPGHDYTVRLAAGTGWVETFPGMSTDSETALAFRAGAAGVRIPDQPVVEAATANVIAGGVGLQGVPQVGQQLSIRSGDSVLGGISPNGGVTYTYVWYRDQEIIPGATAPTYTLTPADLHHAVSAKVVFRAPGLRSALRATWSVVVETGDAPYATTHPVISGAVKVGSRVTVSAGTWSVKDAALAYQWLRDGAVIAGATSRTYTLRPGDRGARVAVRISASAPGRTTGVSVTAPTSPVALGDAAKATKKPKITGTKRVGKKLKVSKGAWSLPGVKVTFQWLRNGKKIAKATKARYKLRAKDRGKRISVRVTVKKPGHKTAKLVTKKTIAIKAKRR